MGTALAQRLQQGGYVISGIISRSKFGAQRLADRVGAPVASTTLRDLPASARLLFCCVPDDTILALAEELASLKRDWSACIVAHTSGARPARALRPLADAGAACLSFHPMQTFAPGAAPEVFEGIYVALEGDERAVAVGRRVAADMGAHPLELPARAKTRVHLAASVASNFFVTLMALAGEILASAGISGEEAQAVLRPLVSETWRGLGNQPPREALTGPIARGDVGTVTEHLATLSTHLPHLAPAYVALAAETVRLAEESSRLSSEAAEQLLDVLHAAIEPEPPR